MLCGGVASCHRYGMCTVRCVECESQFYLLLVAGSRSDKCLTLYVQFWAPDDGRETRLKHVECLIRINKLRKDWLYAENILAMHGHMNVKNWYKTWKHLRNDSRKQHEINPAASQIRSRHVYGLFMTEPWYYFVWRVSSVEDSRANLCSNTRSAAVN